MAQKDGSPVVRAREVPQTVGRRGRRVKEDERLAVVNLVRRYKEHHGNASGWRLPREQDPREIRNLARRLRYQMELAGYVLKTSVQELSPPEADYVELAFWIDGEVKD